MGVIVWVTKVLDTGVLGLCYGMIKEACRRFGRYCYD